MSRDWDWNTDTDSTVVPAVQAVAVYTNPKGDIVVRQQDMYGEDDSVIVVPRQHASRLAKALRDEAKKPFVADEQT